MQNQQTGTTNNNSWKIGRQHEDSAADPPNKIEPKTMDGLQDQSKERSTITWMKCKYAINKEKREQGIIQQGELHHGETATPMKKDQGQDQTG